MYALIQNNDVTQVGPTAGAWSWLSASVQLIPA